jgi:hypothetical protein
MVGGKLAGPSPPTKVTTNTRHGICDCSWAEAKEEKKGEILAIAIAMVQD